MTHHQAPKNTTALSFEACVDKLIAHLEQNNAWGASPPQLDTICTTLELPDHFHASWEDPNASEQPWVLVVHSTQRRLPWDKPSDVFLIHHGSKDEKQTFLTNLRHWGFLHQTSPIGTFYHHIAEELQSLYRDRDGMDGHHDPVLHQQIAILEKLEQELDVLLKEEREGPGFMAGQHDHQLKRLRHLFNDAYLANRALGIENQGSPGRLIMRLMQEPLHHADSIVWGPHQGVFTADENTPVLWRASDHKFHVNDLKYLLPRFLRERNKTHATQKNDTQPWHKKTHVNREHNWFYSAARSWWKIKHFFVDDDKHRPLKAIQKARNARWAMLLNGLVRVVQKIVQPVIWTFPKALGYGFVSIGLWVKNYDLGRTDPTRHHEEHEKDKEPTPSFDGSPHPIDHPTALPETVPLSPSWQRLHAPQTLLFAQHHNVISITHDFLSQSMFDAQNMVEQNPITAMMMASCVGYNPFTQGIIPFELTRDLGFLFKKTHIDNVTQSLVFSKNIANVFGAPGVGNLLMNFLTDTNAHNQIKDFKRNLDEGFFPIVLVSSFVSLFNRANILGTAKYYDHKRFDDRMQLLNLQISRYRTLVGSHFLERMMIAFADLMVAPFSLLAQTASALYFSVKNTSMKPLTALAERFLLLGLNLSDLLGHMIITTIRLAYYTLNRFFVFPLRLALNLISSALLVIRNTLNTVSDVFVLVSQVMQTLPALQPLAQGILMLGRGFALLAAPFSWCKKKLEQAWNASITNTSPLMRFHLGMERLFQAMHDRLRCVMDPNHPKRIFRSVQMQLEKMPDHQQEKELINALLEQWHQTPQNKDGQPPAPLVDPQAFAALIKRMQLEPRTPDGPQDNRSPSFWPRHSPVNFLSHPETPEPGPSGSDTAQPETSSGKKGAP